MSAAIAKLAQRLLVTAWAYASVVKLGGKDCRPDGGLAGRGGDGHPVDIEAMVLGEHLRKVDLDAHREEDARGVECPGLHVGDGCS